MTIRVLFESNNPGGEPRLPVTACAFSGCPEPYARRHGPWRLCARHHEAVLRGLEHRP